MQENNLCVKELLSKNGRMEPSLDFDINLDLDFISQEIQHMEAPVKVGSKIIIDDCPELLDFGRTPAEKVAMHLGFLKAEMESAPHVSIPPAELTKHARRRYGVLLDNVTKLLRKKIKVMCKSDADIDWQAAAELEKRGFVVTYDKVNNTVSVAVYNSAIVV